MDPRDRIRSLRAVAARLEPDAEARAALRDPVVDYGERFLESLPESPAGRPVGDGGAGLFEAPLSEEGIGIAEALRLIEKHVDGPGLNPASSRFMGYIPGGGIYPAALGDYLAAVTNRYAGIFYASPGAVRMETLLIRWMASVVGYPATAAGALLSGGSTGNLAGIVTARDAAGLRSKDLERASIYLTRQAHHSVEKAARIAGLRECPLRYVAVDEGQRMRPDALEARMAEDRAAGLRPWLVVVTAGTTDVGAIDPLDAAADIASRAGAWLHVDGAYGALFALCDEGREGLRGMDRSDSLVLDPHKTLFLPYGTGAVLVKNGELAAASHHYAANYMQDAKSAGGEFSPADVSPELTKHFRGPRLWLPLQLFGLAPFRAALEEKLLLARYFRERLSQVPGFEVGPPPDLSITYFRFVPERGDANAFNEALAQAIQDDGRVFLSTTMLDGNFVIRVAVLSFRTHLDDIETALEVIQEKAHELAAG